jgi:hypothetical protein
LNKYITALNISNTIADGCGKMLQQMRGKIAGGNNTDVANYPWMVSLFNAFFV